MSWRFVAPGNLSLSQGSYLGWLGRQHLKPMATPAPYMITKVRATQCLPPPPIPAGCQNTPFLGGHFPIYLWATSSSPASEESWRVERAEGGILWSASFPPTPESLSLTIASRSLWSMSLSTLQSPAITIRS